MRLPNEKILSLDQVRAQAGTLRSQKKTLVTTNGCFDLLHRGHLTYLVEARKLGDALFVGLNSDASVQQLKGPNRPLQNQEDRLYGIASLECVDGVFLFEEQTPVTWLEKIRPHIHVKGADYEGRSLPEQAIVESFGGRIVLLPVVVGHSTTALLDRIRKT